MASTDARPVPQKAAAYRVTFPILDADGDLVTGATGLDSEVSKDGGAFTDCTNEATEIATSSGVYYLDLTADEMNADTVAVIVKTSTLGAKTTTIVMYPEEAGDIRVNVTQVSGDTTAADTLELFAEALDQSTGQLDSGSLAAGTITAASIDADAITAAKLAADVTTEIQNGLATSAALTAVEGKIDTILVDTGTDIPATLSTIAGYIDTEVAAIKAKTDQLTFSTANRVDAQVFGMEAGTVTASAIATDAIDADALAADALAEVNAQVVDALNVDTYAEPGSGAPAATASIVAKIGYLYKAWRNKVTQTSTEYKVFADDGTTIDQKATIGDDGSTFTRGEVGGP
jgi:hypothetical protein